MPSAQRFSGKPNKLEYKKMFDVEEKHWWYRGLRMVLTHWIAKLHPTTLLDAGCGTGINMQKLSEKGYVVCGVDYSENAIAFTQSRGLKNVRQGTLQNLPFDGGIFDCIYSMDVIGSIPLDDVSAVLREFRRCLKPNGLVILNTAAFEHLRSAQDIAWQIEKRYTLSELTSILQQNNFEIVKATYRNFFLFPVIVMLKWLHKLQMDKKGCYTGSDTDKTNFFVDSVLTPLMRFEAFLLKFIDLPIGSSVFVVAKRK